MWLLDDLLPVEELQLFRSEADLIDSGIPFDSSTREGLKISNETGISSIKLEFRNWMLRTRYLDEQLDDRDEVFGPIFFRFSGAGTDGLLVGLGWMGSIRFFSINGDPDGLFRGIDPLLSIGEGSRLDEFRPESGSFGDFLALRLAQR